MSSYNDYGSNLAGPTGQDYGYGQPQAAAPYGGYDSSQQSYGTDGGYGGRGTTGGGPPRGNSFGGDNGRGFSVGSSQGGFDRGGFEGRGRGGGFGGGRGGGFGGRQEGGGGYGDRSSGGGGGGYGADRVQAENQIYVSGLPRNLSEDDIGNFFGSIGVIKTDKRTGKLKIWIYKDNATGDQKGEATVTYDDHAAAQSAITWFDGKDFNGCRIKVQMAMIKAAPMNRGGGRGGFDRGGGRGGFDRGGGRGGFDRNGGHGGFDRGGGRGGFDRDRGGRGDASSQSNFRARPGDWTCTNPSCGNTNFAWRNNCNKCNTDKPYDSEDGGSAGTGANAGGFSRGRGGFGGDRRGGSDRGFGDRGRDRGSFGNDGGNDFGSRPPQGGGFRGDRGGNDHGGWSGGGSMRGGDRGGSGGRGRGGDRYRPY